MTKNVHFILYKNENWKDQNTHKPRAPDAQKLGPRKIRATNGLRCGQKS